MSDLKSQLAAAFGRDPNAVADAPSASAPAADPRDPLLADDAHLASDWVVRLRQLRGAVPSPPDLAPRPKLGQAQMVTDQLLKALKKAGRKREARELADLRSSFLARRDKAAWGAVKARFAELDLSQKAYRALKQGGTDPLVALQRLDAADAAELKAMGAARLRELLG